MLNGALRCQPGGWRPGFLKVVCLSEPNVVRRKRIIFLACGDINQMFAETARDNCTEPFRKFREACQERGFSLELPGRQPIEECAWCLFWDVSSVDYWRGLKGLARRVRYGHPLWGRDWFGEAESSRGDLRSALFLWEPPAVSPANWRTGATDGFSLVFTWNDDVVREGRAVKLYGPLPEEFPEPQTVAFAKRKTLIAIFNNKESKYKNELYSARREAIEHFDRNYPQQFDLYGNGWNRKKEGESRQGRRNQTGTISCYRGPVVHKWDVLPGYKFALCYENISDQPGWITEKIFDCMRAGSVPIYLGAPNVTDYVDPGTFVDMRQFASCEELGSYITNITEAEYEQYRSAIRNYLDSERFREFLGSRFAQRIVEGLGLGRHQ